MSRIEPTAKDPGAYDVVVLAFPLWASLMPPAMRMYIFENMSKFKKVALFQARAKATKRRCLTLNQPSEKRLLPVLCLSKLN